MAELQSTDLSGENAQRFIEFIMMHAQQAAFYLGQIPNPQTGQAEVHLDAAQMFIDQLTMLRAKTRGNLTNDETAVLSNAISSLQMAFFEISQGAGPAPEAPATAATEPEPAAPAKPETPVMTPGEIASSESESKKKFTKSYGA